MAIGFVEVTNTTALKPHAPDEPQFMSESFIPTAQVPLPIFDRVALDMYFSILFVFRPPMPVNSALKKDLARALSYFPQLSGRLVAGEGRRPHIVLNGAGIRLIEATVSSTVEENLPLKLSPELSRLSPSLDGAEELLLVQLNRFTCGGLIVCTSTCHKIADGQSLSHFLTTWAKLVREHDDIDRLPCHDRSIISIPWSPLRCDFDHFKNEISKSPPSLLTSSQNVEIIALHFSPDFIAKLKANVSGSIDVGRRCTTFKCLLTHVWKKLTLARGLRSEEVTRVRVAVNGRPRLRPSVPTEYFGNLVLWAYPTMTAKEVLEESYGDVAAEIEKAVDKIDESYFRSFIDFGDVLKRRGKDDFVDFTEEHFFPNLEVDSYLTFNYHEIDFGTGPLCAFFPLCRGRHPCFHSSMSEIWRGGCIRVCVSRTCQFTTAAFSQPGLTPTFTHVKMRFYFIEAH